MRHSAPLRCMRVTNFEIPVFVGKNNDKPMSKQMYSSSGIWPCCVCFSVFFQIIAKSLLWIQLSKLSCSLMWCQLIQGWRQQDQNIWGSAVNKKKQKKSDLTRPEKSWSFCFWVTTTHFSYIDKPCVTTHTPVALRLGQYQGHFVIVCIISHSSDLKPRNYGKKCIQLLFGSVCPTLLFFGKTHPTPTETWERVGHEKNPTVGSFTALLLVQHPSFKWRPRRMR